MSVQLRARAAMAELAIGMFAFNPRQPRGADGRWIKGGAGATPSAPTSPPRAPAKKAAAKAVKPKAAPGPRAWMDHVRGGGEETPAITRQVKEMFEFQDPETGLRAEVKDVMSNRNSSRPAITVRVSIRDADDREVGQAMRSVWPDKKDPSKLEVHHGSFLLTKRLQGGGFSSRWLRQMEQRYKASGIDQMSLFTEDVGGYAWAKAGFDFQESEGVKHAASRLSRNIRSKDGQRDLPQRVITDGEELVRRAQSEDRSEWPTPMEFAMLGWTPGATSWVGKETMLNSGWAGVKQL
jgi:hypothetical protein